jgi:hypothetical protein
MVANGRSVESQQETWTWSKLPTNKATDMVRELGVALRAARKTRDKDIIVPVEHVLDQLRRLTDKTWR